MNKTLRNLLALTLIGVTAVIGWLMLDYRSVLHSPMKVDAGTKYVIEQGSSLRRIVADLEQQGLLDKGYYLLVHARLTGDARRLKAGEYAIEPGMSPVEFLERVVHGRVIQYAFTIVEGWNFHQLMDAIGSDDVLVQTLQGRDKEQVMEAVGYAGEHPEGRFLPDTYYFPRGTTDVAFLQRAYRAMERYLEQEWQARSDGLPVKTPYEALILASIIEKETGLPSERKEIAGVFVRRLQKGMRLQTDPTVIYGMGEAYDGRIRRRDLQRDTPYNTYRRGGLPPTPIAMPGRASIRAALHPKSGEVLYFVSRGDGSHKFSVTLDEHNQAVIKYQLGGRPRNFSSYTRPADASAEPPAESVAQ